MKTKTLFLHAISLLLCNGCTSENPREHLSSETDRLMPVIREFERNPADSLELRAAVFLLAHMPGHYEYTGGSVSAYREYIDSVYPDMSPTVRKVVLSAPYYRAGDSEDLSRIYDTDAISLELLIEHIRNRVECYRRAPWLKSLSFEDFCEYILPYRADREPLEWPESDSMKNVWKAVSDHVSFFPFLPPAIETALSAERQRSGNKDDDYRYKLTLPDRTLTFDCVENTYYRVHGLRAAGIPCAVDFIPHWPTRNGQHYWLTVIDPGLLYSNLSEVRNPKAAKVYRKTYSRNPVPQPRNAREYIPELFRSPFNRDVSSHYMKVTDIELDVNGKDDPRHVYLAVFNNLEWHPVAWAEVKRNKALFRDMGTDVVYLPVYYRGEEMVALSAPFLAGEKGIRETYRIDADIAQDMVFHRKYPLTLVKTQWARELTGTEFHAANRPDFSDSTVIHRVEKPHPHLGWTEIPVHTKSGYRYWRAYKNGRMLNFGEIEFLGTNGKRLFGEIITATPDERKEDAFDGNVLTYNRSYSWIGMDFGKPVNLSAIRYISRNDDNAVVDNELYQLLYFGQEGWEEFDTIEADGDSVLFRGVPSGGLYWLRNLDKGIEERIFTFENGRPVFR